MTKISNTFAQMTEEVFNIEELKKKVVAGPKLTREEEIFYLIKLMNHTRQEAEYVVDFHSKRSNTTYIH